MNDESTLAPARYTQDTSQKKWDITLTIGVFFDGTSNNAHNRSLLQTVCPDAHSVSREATVETVSDQCIRRQLGIHGTAAGSYLGDYTNIYWLYSLYHQGITPDSEMGQVALYISGIGTEDGIEDSTYSIVTGNGNSGVMKKTDQAVVALAGCIQDYIRQYVGACACRITRLQFDLFGFSRGAAAARHFANRVFRQDPAIVEAIQFGLKGIEFCGPRGGGTRFLGIFDTVAAIGTPVNGFNPHNADTGGVNLVLRPGVAEKVFHITAQHECRFNFALNSVKPSWPELALPGVHADIGGGYPPDENETYFITRPRYETVPLFTSDTGTRIYQQTREQLSSLEGFPAIAPLLQVADVDIETWHDARMPADRYGTLQKRSGAAAVITRSTRNDWSKVVLRVMLDAAQHAGVIFTPLDDVAADLSVRPGLKSLCEKALEMGRALRNGQRVNGFTAPEITMLAEKYIHCSANWNSVVRDHQGAVTGSVRPLKWVTFINRPDERWQRTVYDMDGRKI
ncbi:T6SS phospholipase effector Tle1-like catalytic domain-containing protein [Yokenella regensburgei]|uniref:T6SS phospholipase effector Tle1-like catalytic domain-containing protein n=1 Tax=Yokenella regensburgei TaxID=158877 RepID=UPI0014333C6C|nr:DUF2235 domain-containing protein [Yokenella regensburgei]QIU88439.1 DUF2235 domain-containing protein [Yokenella regensburgei]